MPSFASHPVLLKNLFHPRLNYSMPIYQRPFSWTDQTGDQACLMIWSMPWGMGDDEGSQQIEAFFLGAIILTENMNPVEPKSQKLGRADNRRSIPY